MLLTSEICIDLIESFQHLQNEVRTLQKLMCEQDALLPAWFQPPECLKMHASPRKNAHDFISLFEYVDGQLPKETLLGPGLISASKETLDQLHLVNTCKMQFKQIMLLLRASNISAEDPFLVDDFEKLLSKRPSSFAKAMHRMGLARIHLKQCYRILPILPTRPSKVSWTWANTRAIKRISQETAFSLLQKQGSDPNIEQQIAKLQRLKEKEMLAIVQELAPHLRVNLVFSSENGTSTRKMIKGPVPIFYPYQENEPLPRIKPPSQKKLRDINRSQRKDLKLDPNPFLPSIHAHRYF